MYLHEPEMNSPTRSLPPVSRPLFSPILLLFTPISTYVNMNGLRTLASQEDKLENFRFQSDGRYDNATVMEIVPNLHEPGASHWLRQDAVNHLLLAKFLEHGSSALSSPDNEVQGENSRATHGTKLVVVARKDILTILMNRSNFQQVLHTISPDPLYSRIFHAGYYRNFDFSGSIANGGTATMQIRAGGFWFMLSIRQHKEDPTFDSRCVATKVVDRLELPLSAHCKHLRDCLEHLKEEACSPLYLPFALSVHGVCACRKAITDIEKWVISLHETTSWGRLDNNNSRGGVTHDERAKFVQQNRTIGSSMDYLAYAKGLLNGLESLWQYLETMAGEISPSAKTDQVVQSTNNILEAIRLLRQEVQSKKEILRDKELRIRNQAELVSSPSS